jgi:hypothetical protein
VPSLLRAIKEPLMTAARLRFLLAALLACCASSLPLSAQALFREARPIRIPSVWTIDDSGDADFTDLPPAVASARSGDVLLVAPGNYTAFALGKGLTILGNGGRPRIDGWTSVASLRASA